MRKARGAKKTPSPREPISDKKFGEANNDLLKCPDDGGAAPRARKKGYKPPDVRSIFGAQGRRGEGHEFTEEASEGWCDVCCAIIFQGGLMCTGCKYTCHAECRDHVTLDCHQNGSSNDVPLSQDHLNNNQVSHNDVEKEKDLRTHLSHEEIKHNIELYNAATRDHFKMTLNPDGLYTGFIKVQLELRRPITVTGGVPGTKAAEAFYLPRGSVNTLHISSSNTVQQVIEALLRKFTVADNPAKFALYKRFRREDHVCVCKLSETEHPLLLRLLAGPNLDTLSFVLREQQTGEVMWDAFSIPELCNFLRILEKEEQDQVRVITARYNMYREKLEEALRATSSHN
ncbi:ras association domain-containing protein 3 isoform X1 [Tachysurus fulvidraco]|uniref:ras association domain-containing protein 3 isoform X1 n=1 Tax=Tachysurus fulvidraco TaxID=1234273 RepID=UPI000F4F665C|nr:ras association domain-containing protein 3 isoform X1 [Tachysurus fulvidraco]